MNIKRFGIVLLIAASVTVLSSAILQGLSKKGSPRSITVSQKTTIDKKALKTSGKKTKLNTQKDAVKPRSSAKSVRRLPRLVDLGASKCIPCKMMKPILEDLSDKYKGKLKVEFIDVWKDNTAIQKYKIQSIPTQIFYDTKGKEFDRHAGYLPEKEILLKFKSHGIKLDK